MNDPLALEEAYLQFSKNLSQWAHDGIIQVNLCLLNDLGLLNHQQLDSSSDQFMHYFHIIETQDKVTLFNEQFVIWIVPTMQQEVASTLTYIARFIQEKPTLELVFSASGVYNTPKYILRILHHFLNEVIDTEEVISSIRKKK